jgi:hypothetical protein
MNKELVQKYCNNCWLNDEELNIVLAWFEESASTAEGKSLLFQIWDDFDEEDDITDVNFDLMLDKIHHIANLNKSERLLEKANQNIVFKPNSKDAEEKKGGARSFFAGKSSMFPIILGVSTSFLSVLIKAAFICSTCL